jgi:anti-anti-sigma factor
VSKEAKGILSVTEQDGTMIIRFTRSQIFDVETAEALDYEFKQVLRGKGQGTWVIDFAGLELIISRVINSLLVALRLVREAHGEIYLCNMGQTVGRVLRLAKLDRVFRTFPTLDEALAAGKKARSG